MDDEYARLCDDCGRSFRVDEDSPGSEIDEDGCILCPGCKGKP